MSRFLAIIPARAGSKGIPFKNMRLLSGLPLIGHSIRAALYAKCRPRIVISTDSCEIADFATSMGVPTTRLRPMELSGDDALTIDVVRYELAACEAESKESFDHILLLQPTSPLRNAHHIDRAVERYHEAGAPSLISVCEVGPGHPDYMYRVRNGSLEKMTEGASGVRRQCLETVYLRNGAIYIVAVSDFKRTGELTTANPAFYVMDRHSSVNIDEPEDIRLAEALLTSGY
jgi:CMP-N,N'-diacetyllegionaminic acid synthase